MGYRIARAPRMKVDRPMRASITMGGANVIGREGETVDLPWWSFSKLVIASAALKLVELGSLNLDAPLPAREFTLRQLLQHEAGLPNYGWLESYHLAVASGDDPWTPDETIARTVQTYPQWPPGTRWAYSNIGYYYVGALIAETVGTSLGEALNALVLTQAGVRSARLATSKADLEAVQMGISGYDPRWVLHGLLVGNLADAASFLFALLSGRVLGVPIFAEMLNVHLLPQFRDELWGHPAYGLGLMGAWDGLATPCGHSGEGPGSAIAVYGKVVGAEVRVSACWESPGTSREAERVALDLLEQA